MEFPSFTFSTSAQILFGTGVIRQLGRLASGFGRRVLLVCGVPDTLQESICAILSDSELKVHVFAVREEPSLAVIQSGLEITARNPFDVLIGLGGGSAIDTAKAIAALAANPFDPMNYLEVVGQGARLEKDPLPCIAVPTTAGTGAEVTRNAVIHISDQNVKVSLRDTRIIPRIALVDPDLTLGLPKSITATTGMDALTQILEPFVSTRSNPITDAMCRDGLARVATALRGAYQNGTNTVFRREMSLVSLFGGLALTNAGLGAVHGLAAPLGGQLRAAHGALCAQLLPVVTGTNLRLLRKSSGSSAGALDRYKEAARLLTGVRTAAPEDAVSWLRDLCIEMSIPTLGEQGLKPSLFEMIAEQAEAASSMKTNPIALSRQEILSILADAL